MTHGPLEILSIQESGGYEILLGGLKMRMALILIHAMSYMFNLQRPTI